jgi:hypothetical protein
MAKRVLLPLNLPFPFGMWTAGMPPFPSGNLFEQQSVKKVWAGKVAS